MLQAGKILMIDDEPSVCQGCQRIFEKEGYTMQIALSGNEGLQKAYQNTYDVIITDLKIPDINGIDVLRRI